MTPPSEGSDLSEEGDSRFKSSLHRPKYKNKRSFRLKKKKFPHQSTLPGCIPAATVSSIGRQHQQILGSNSPIAAAGGRSGQPPHQPFSTSGGGLASLGEPLKFSAFSSNALSPTCKFTRNQSYQESHALYLFFPRGLFWNSLDSERNPYW